MKVKIKTGLVTGKMYQFNRIFGDPRTATQFSFTSEMEHFLPFDRIIEVEQIPTSDLLYNWNPGSHIFTLCESMIEHKLTAAESIVHDQKRTEAKIESEDIKVFSSGTIKPWIDPPFPRGEEFRFQFPSFKMEFTFNAKKSRTKKRTYNLNY